MINVVAKRDYEIRLIGYSGRVFMVYGMGAGTLREAVDTARTLVTAFPEVAGAQVHQTEPVTAGRSVH